MIFRQFKVGELKSSLVKDILLTSNTFHSSYRNYERIKKGEVKIEKILTGFKILINYNGKINDFVIKKVFRKIGGNWIYYIWKSQGEVNFKKMINIFNERKHYLKDHTTMKFLQKYYQMLFLDFIINLFIQKEI